jgi:hypothetical protein
MKIGINIMTKKKLQYIIMWKVFFKKFNKYVIFKWFEYKESIKQQILEACITLY